MSRERLKDNPFYVLGLRPEAARAEVEREGQKLLAMLELGLAAARTYPTPLGPVPRTADKVRAAMAELRDPHKRLLHELWAQLPAVPLDPDPPAAAQDAPAAADAPAPWPDALCALGFGARRPAAPPAGPAAPAAPAAPVSGRGDAPR